MTVIVALIEVFILVYFDGNCIRKMDAVTGFSAGYTAGSENEWCTFINVTERTHTKCFCCLQIPLGMSGWHYMVIFNV